VVHVELESPFTAEQFLNAQAIHAMAPVPADVELGPYDMGRTRFTNCRISVDLPQVNQVRHERMDYAKRRQRKFQ
jgi:hypothetical protein